LSYKAIPVQKLLTEIFKFGAGKIMENFSKWTYIRIICVATGILNGLATNMQSDVSPWLLAGVATIVMPLLMIIVVAMNSRRFDPVWLAPSWHTNPFALKQPFQFFHMVAFMAFTTSITILIRSFWVSISLLPQAILNLAFGLGLLVGIYICMIIYDARMESKDQT